MLNKFIYKHLNANASVLVYECKLDGNNGKLA
jgi:hypothetical protein